MRQRLAGIGVAQSALPEVFEPIRRKCRALLRASRRGDAEYAAAATEQEHTLTRLVIWAK